MSIQLAKGSLIILSGTTLSDHNRSALEIPSATVKFDNRLANGDMRRYFVAAKRQFKMSWELLPAKDNRTADGQAGRNTLRQLVDANWGNQITFKYKEVDNSNTEFNVVLQVFIDDYSESLTKRWETQYWNCELDLTEA